MIIDFVLPQKLPLLFRRSLDQSNSASHIYISELSEKYDQAPDLPMSTVRTELYEQWIMNPV